jgi:hypothetical protein
MRLHFALIAALALFIAQGARAADQPLDQAKASFKAGAAAYGAGDYLAAIQAFDAAYRVTPLPAIAFSLAQAERRQYFASRDAKHLARAVELYRLYLTQVASGGRRADATDALGQLEALLLAQPADVAGTATAPGARLGDKTRLLVSGNAPKARISLDGGPLVASPLIAEVAPGPHSVRIEADGFFPEVRQLVALPGVLVPADVDLRERPATVLIRGAEGADVYVDGHFAGRAAKQFPLQLSSGPHRLIFAKAGHRLESVSVTLARGERRNLGIALRNTRQRTAAFVLFGSGAGLVGIGAQLGLETLNYEAEAARLLRKRSSSHLTARELEDYRDATRTRNQLRTVSIITLSLGGAGLLTGLALFELDEPNLGEVLRAPGSRAGGFPQVAVTPAPEGIGLGARLEL